MPKASMYKQAQMIFWEDDIRFSGEVSPMDSEAVTEAMRQGTNDHFRLRVFAFDLAHHFGAFLRAEHICAHHESPIGKLDSNQDTTSSAVFSPVCFNRSTMSFPDRIMTGCPSSTISLYA